MTVRYQLQRRRNTGPVPDIEDPAYRSRVISFAATGMSRRGVASAIGKPEATLRGWVERGLAYPEREPWGSFAVDYRRAERALEGAAAGTVAWVARRLWTLTQVVDRGEREGATTLEQEHAAQAATVLLENPQLKELLNVLQARFPEDWGASAHRKPEPEFDGTNYLNEHAMNREQLGALLADPPEPIRLALQDQAAAVYRILVEGGFDPSAPVKRKAEHEV